MHEPLCDGAHEIRFGASCAEASNAGERVKKADSPAARIRDSVFMPFYYLSMVFAITEFAVMSANATKVCLCRLTLSGD